jgi:Phage integrase, N-terminal SAM-like domain
MGDGYIRQRGNAWQVIVHAGRDPITGKRRNLTGTARTKREAQALRAQLVNQANEGRRPPTDATLAQLLERWLEMADLAWSTRVTYRGYLDRTILPALGHLPLRRLDTATLDRFYTTLRTRGGTGGRPMAPATVRQVHAIQVLRTSPPARHHRRHPGAAVLHVEQLAPATGAAKGPTPRHQRIR